MKLLLSDIMNIYSKINKSIKTRKFGMEVNNTLYNQKNEILHYLRDRAEESYSEICRTYGNSEFKKRAGAINKKVILTSDTIKAIISQRSASQNWTQDEILQSILMVTYCSYIVMIEFRNRAWEYEYMTFARRIGELWEPFCKLCFHHPIRTDMQLCEAPLFSDVKESLQNEINKYIHSLNISEDEQKNLINYYDKVWSLVTSGEIKLELDLHFTINDTKYNIDFKSGFQSNEKGNTNRLLLVASIYKNIIAQNHTCMLFVRAEEDDNNHYLQTLKNSAIWDVYCAKETYNKIHEYSGFNLTQWIENNIDWNNDLDSETLSSFQKNDLTKYLSW